MLTMRLAHGLGARRRPAGRRASPRALSLDRRDHGGGDDGDEGVSHGGLHRVRPYAVRLHSFWGGYGGAAALGRSLAGAIFRLFGDGR